MMEAALAATVASTVAGTAVQVQGANRQAKSAAQAAALELQQYEAEAKAQAMAAAQERNAIDKAMNDSLSAQRALLGSRGLDPYGSTGRTLMAATEDEAAADRENSAANAGRAATQLRLGQRQSTLRARSAIAQANDQATGAIIGGVGSLAKTGYGYLSRADTTRPAAGSGGAGNGGGR